MNCPICQAAGQFRPPLEISKEFNSKLPVPVPDLNVHLERKSLEQNLRDSGVLAFQNAPQPLSRDANTFGILGGSVSMSSDRLTRTHRELPQLDEVREVTRLKIPHKEMRKIL